MIAEQPCWLACRYCGQRPWMGFDSINHFASRRRTKQQEFVSFRLLMLEGRTQFVASRLYRPRSIVRIQRAQCSQGTDRSRPQAFNADRFRMTGKHHRRRSGQSSQATVECRMPWRILRACKLRLVGSRLPQEHAIAIESQEFQRWSSTNPTFYCLPMQA